METSKPLILYWYASPVIPDPPFQLNWGCEMITKKKIQVYEDVRQSGLTNMFDIKSVIALSRELLTKADCIDIMQNYSTYIEKYKINREG